MIGTAESVRDTFAAIPGGVRIMGRADNPRFVGGCTLGFNLYDMGSGGRWFATNSHCTADRWAIDPARPTRFYQPFDNQFNEADPTRYIGLEDWDPPMTDGAYHWKAGSVCHTFALASSLSSSLVSKLCMPASVRVRRRPASAQVVSSVAVCGR